MPSDTFIKLSDEKKNKIIDSAIKEFSRVPIEEASIKNIVEDAGIARGSFYQYFDSKEDVLFYLMNDDLKKIQEFTLNDLEYNNDVFKLFVNIYCFTVSKIFNENNRLYSLHKMVLNNVKASGEKNMMPPPPMVNNKDRIIAIPEEKIIEKINRSDFKFKDDKDVVLLVKLLKNVLTKSLIDSINIEDNEKSREEFIRTLDLIKYGMVKK